jgi:hypothetical protein
VTGSRKGSTTLQRKTRAASHPRPEALPFRVQRWHKGGEQRTRMAAQWVRSEASSSHQAASTRTHCSGAREWRRGILRPAAAGVKADSSSEGLQGGPPRPLPCPTLFLLSLARKGFTEDRPVPTSSTIRGGMRGRSGAGGRVVVGTECGQGGMGEWEKDGGLGSERMGGESRGRGRWQVLFSAQCASPALLGRSPFSALCSSRFPSQGLLTSSTAVT